MKKKKSVMIWTILTVAGLVLTILGFLFIGVQDCAKALSQSYYQYLAPLTFKTIAYPFKHGFKALGNFSGYLAMNISNVVIMAALVIVLVLLIWASVVRRKAKYVGQIILVVLCAVVGFYCVSYVCMPAYAETGKVMTFAREIVSGKGIVFDGLLFKYNVGLSIFLYVFLIGCVLTLVAAIGLAIVTFRRILACERVAKKVKAPKEANEVKEVSKKEAAKESAPVAIASSEEHVDAPRKTRKVVLVVKRYDAFKDGQHAPIERPTEYPRKQVEVKPLTIEDIRAAFKEELSEHERKCHSDKQEDVHKEQKPSYVSEADATAKKDEEALTPTPIIITIPEPVVEQKAPEVKEVKKESIGKEEVRDIIRDELVKALKEFNDSIEDEVVVEPVKEEKPVEETKVIDETVKVEEVKPVEEKEAVINENNEVVEATKEEVAEVKPVEAPVVEEPVKEEAPVVEEVKPVEEPVKEEAPVVEEVKPVEEPVKEEAPVVETPVVEEAAEEKPAVKVERVSFAQRMKEADDSLKDSYNQIKSLLLSYGLKNRISNGGDAFRLHKVNYCKITVAGNSLKLYLALDPADYKNSTLPVKDASSKAIYKDIPLVFKVKSGLSLRRAEQLITEMMDKHGVEQVDRVQVKDYVAELDNIEATSDESDDE